MQGILLINLGSPKKLDLNSVKSYLREFLSDDLVIDLPKPIQKFLVNFIIVPIRSKNTLEAYSSIWTNKGSPLITNTQSIADALAEESQIPVSFAMRYQTPSISEAIGELSDKGCNKIKVIPLYPHYAMATSLTTINEVKDIVSKEYPDTEVSFISSFHDGDGYIDSLSNKIAQYFTDDFDYLLFSYHGIPERHIRKTDPTQSHCLKNSDCCSVNSSAKPFCYRAQVLETSRLCAERLKLDGSRWGVSFQSRIGPGWLKPFSDITLKELPGKGNKKIAVVCPSFVADNLETLEEMEIRGRETFMEAGGESFTYIPCLNSDDSWINYLNKLVK